MSRDLSLYLKELAPAVDGDFEASDDRLLAIIDLFEKRKFGLAADKAEELAQAGIFDIRPISYVLFAAFYEDGIAALGSVFDVVAAALGRQSAFIGPQKNQAAFFSKRLIWLWKTIADHLAFYRKAAGADWDRIRAGLTVDSLAIILERGKQVDSALTGAAHENTAMSLATLMGELRTLASELEVASRAVPESTVDKASSKAEVKEEDSVSDDDTINPVEQVAKTKVPRGGKQSITLEVSQAFLDLLAKLRAFETLLNQGEHMKAAIVAEDVQNTLDNFDPRSYFPQMFSRFSELLSHHAELIGNNIENRDSFSWKTMAQFYKVDVDKFVQGEGNGRGRKR